MILISIRKKKMKEEKNQSKIDDSDKIKENTGNIIPLTELPGISALTDTLRYENSSRTKIIALANLEYMYRPEYKDDYKSLLEIVANDKDANVAQYASEMLRNLA